MMIDERMADRKTRIWIKIARLAWRLRTNQLGSRLRGSTEYDSELCTVSCVVFIQSTTRCWIALEREGERRDDAM